MPKVLLIIPRNKTLYPFRGKPKEQFSEKITFPIGIMNLASSLSIKNEVSVIDSNLYNDARISNEISSFEPDFIGITASSLLYSKSFHDTVNSCKEISDAKIVVGGPHASAVPRLVMNNHNIDFLVIGEAEETFPSLVSGKKEADGIVFRNGEKIIFKPKKKFITDIDNIPFSGYHFADMEKYLNKRRNHMFTKNKRAIPFVTSRGCPKNCFFCSISSSMGRFWRARSPENIMSEILYLRDNYHINEVLFEDDNLTLNRKRAIELFDKLKEVDIDWATPNGVDISTLDEDILNSAANSGCYHIKFGIESGSSVIQRMVGKVIDREHTRRINDKCEELNIITSAFMIVGLPGENDRTIKETQDFLDYVNFENVFFYVPLPIPGTRLFEYYKEKGLVGLDDFGNITKYHPEEGILQMRDNLGRNWKKRVFLREINPFHWNLNHGLYSILIHSHNLFDPFG